MAVSRHRLKLFLLVLLVIEHVISRSLSSLDQSCKEDVWYIDQKHTSVITCINLSNNEDVQILFQLMNDASQVVLRFQSSIIGLLPNDVFEGHPIISMYMIASGLEEIPYQFIKPICGLSLTTLWVTKNQIAAIRDGGFNGCSKILTLDLSENGIRAISGKAFQGLDNLQELNLQYNEIQVFTGFQGLGALKALFLTKNGMDVVHGDALHGMDQLELLDLGYNQLTTLEADTLVPMTINDTTRLNPRRYLYLEGNPWNCTCSLQWLQEWFLDNGYPKNDPECASPEKGPLMYFELCETAHSSAIQGPTIGLLSQYALILITCAHMLL